jgi:hypothetical protein
MGSEASDRQSRLFDDDAAVEPVLISACLPGIPCRWHGRRAKRRDKLIDRLRRKYAVVPVFFTASSRRCPSTQPPKPWTHSIAAARARSQRRVSSPTPCDSVV